MSDDTNDCAGALLLRDGRVLLGLRAQQAPRFPGRWDVLGGRVRVGETFAGALARELEEEAGVVPTVFRELFRRAMPTGGVMALFLVTAWRGGEPGLRGHEHLELCWLPAAEAARLPNLVAPELAAILRDIARGEA